LIEYLKIGKLVAAHGVKGELLLKHSLGKKTSLKGLQALYTEENKNSFLPWFIETASPRNAEEILLKLETINSREAAMRLVPKEIWLPEPDVKKLAAKTSPVNLLGYTVIHEKESLGEILEVIEQPHQLLCRLEIGGKEVLIPLHEEFLKKINHQKKQVTVSLPEGLLDIYLT
jgi:16S rRNA processing protein RimM